MSVFDSSKVAQVETLLARAQNIAITCHKSPDGDAIGSALGLWHVLRASGFRAHVVVPDRFPQFLKWMPGADQCLVADQDEAATLGALAAADLVFCLDYNDLTRTGVLTETLRASVAPKVMVDHHQDPDDFAAIQFSDTSSCSTAQMIYEWVEASARLEHLSTDAMACLYTGIVTDSGSFRFSSVTPETHRIAAGMMEHGLQPHLVHQALFDTNEESRLRLTGYALSEKLQVWREYCTAVISLSEAELERFNYQPGDTEGLVNQALSIKGIRMAAFIKEGNGYVKMSLRSKGTFTVNELAGAHFEGGGHINAAGGRSDLTLEETLEQFKAILPQYERQLCAG